MKTSKIYLLTLTLIGFLFASIILPNQIFAQQKEKPIKEEPIFLSINFMKVQSENIQEYRKLEAAWKKIHQARVKKGTLLQWTFIELAIPYGTNNEYNFITINTYQGSKMLADHYEGGMMEGFEKLLTPEEIKLVKKTGKMRDMVKEEIFRVRGGTGSSEKPAKIAVVNFMKTNKGFRGRDLGKIENTYWKPVHEKRVKEGKMNGWGMYSLEFPYGSSRQYNNTTVDFFDNMEQMLADYDYPAEMKKKHANITFDEIVAKTQEVRDLVKAEVWMVLDQTDFPKPMTAEKK